MCDGKTINFLTLSKSRRTVVVSVLRMDEHTDKGQSWDFHRMTLIFQYYLWFVDKHTKSCYNHFNLPYWSSKRESNFNI